jgi:predicted DNA-binding transcriptional regulator AlpA
VSESEKYLSNEGLAERYGVPVKTVRKWRYEGTGPQGFRVGRHVRYRESDVLYWEEQQIREQRSAAAS